MKVCTLLPPQDALPRGALLSVHTAAGHDDGSRRHSGGRLLLVKWDVTDSVKLSAFQCKIALNSTYINGILHGHGNN